MRHQLRALAQATERFLTNPSKEHRTRLSGALEDAYRILQVRPKSGELPRLAGISRGRAHDLTGYTFGALRALEVHRKLKAGYSWLAYCLTCGKIQHRLGTHLVGGHRDHCVFCRAYKPPGRAQEMPAPNFQAISDYRENFETRRRKL